MAVTGESFHYATAQLGDLEELVALRIEAMRESLERIGRFDVARARERVAATFEPAATRFIVARGERVGFVVVKERDDGLLLEHLYLRPSAQGAGLGSAIMRDVIGDAERRQLALHVEALRQSEANRFYRRHGFEVVGESEWDIHYRRDSQHAK